MPVNPQVHHEVRETLEEVQKSRALITLRLIETSQALEHAIPAIMRGTANLHPITQALLEQTIQRMIDLNVHLITESMAADGGKEANQIIEALKHRRD